MKLNIDTLGERKRTSNPNQVRFCCPNCDDEKYHLYVHLVKKLFYCQKCEFKGKLESLAPSLDRIEEKIREVINPIKEKYQKEIEMKLPNFFTTFSNTSDLPWKYLVERGLTSLEILKYKIGYCSGGEYSERIIVPIYKNKRLIYFVGRSFTNKEPRYFNSISFSKKGVIFTTFQEDKVDHAFVVEGVFDAIKIGRFSPAISLLGKRADAKQIQEIARRVNTVTVMLDRDAAKEQWELIKQLSFHIPTKYVFLDNYKDPDEIPFKELKKLIGGKRQ